MIIWLHQSHNPRNALRSGQQKFMQDVASVARLSIPTQSQAGVMSLGVSLPTKWMCSRQLQVISLVDGFVALWSELTSNTSSLYVRLHVRCLRILLRKNLCRRLHSQRACMINHELCRRVRRWGYRSDRAAACNMTNVASDVDTRCQ